GFIEMSTSSEALKAAEELQSKPTYISGTRLIGILSEKFSGLTNGSESVFFLNSVVLLCCCSACFCLQVARSRGREKRRKEWRTEHSHHLRTGSEDL
ncbi:hypothetical protein GOODEAATRI_025636, partial [Goodea atripinnis]